jgi:pimeloyl-ACP methyl ester carboxylesterase
MPMPESRLVRDVVLLPGAAGAGAFWAPLIERLPGDWHARSIDLPGLGSVPAQPGVDSYDELVDYVARTITGPTVVVAQSMGTYIALQLTLRYSHLVTHLILVAATGGVDIVGSGATDWRQEYTAAYPHARRWACASVADLTGRLHEISIPVLLLWPTRDALSPLSVAHNMASKLARAALVTFDSDDHWIVRRFPGESAAAIQLFIEQSQGFPTG